MKAIFLIFVIIGLIMAIKRAKNKGVSQYRDKTTKQYKRWYK